MAMINCPQCNTFHDVQIVKSDSELGMKYYCENVKIDFLTEALKTIMQSKGEN